MRHKRPAKEQYGIECDAAVVEMWRRELPSTKWKILHGDAIELLADLSPGEGTFVYADPPYHPDTRRRTRVYRHDYTVAEHERFLACLTKLPCNVMISGYNSPLYETVLATWNRYNFQMQTRVGLREECVWFNYSLPQVLHDSRYMGDNFRQREIIRRRQDRLRNRIQKLSAVEQSSLHEWFSRHLSQEKSR